MGRAISDFNNILFSIIMFVVLILVFILWIVKKYKNRKREINHYNYYKICLKFLDYSENFLNYMLENYYKKNRSKELDNSSRLYLIHLYKKYFNIGKKDRFVLIE